MNQNIVFSSPQLINVREELKMVESELSVRLAARSQWCLIIVLAFARQIVPRLPRS